MTLEAGMRFGGYEIVAAIGAGAMGQVYRARELRLGRDVALKVLPPDIEVGDRAAGGGASSDAHVSDERRARFEREARALASLNHPNIAQIYGIVDAQVRDGETVTALAMELVEGQTLAQAIPPSGLRPSRLLEIAIELADALAEAHARGVIHRDLKPANIMVRADGHVKVLDFGLAKLRSSLEGGEADAATAMETVAGGVLGTPAYMSPEQAEARAVDGRSDLFSLGVLLYEAGTGMRPFSGSSPFAILWSIVRDSPVPMTDRNHDIPPALAGVIALLLEKDPRRRYQTATELRAALEAVRLGTSRGAPVRLPRVGRRPALAAAGVMVGASALFAVWKATRHEPAPLIGTVEQVTTEEGTETHPSLSPDGNWTAYAASGEIYLRRVGTENPVHLTGDMSRWADEPAFSPDGRLIAFSARRDGTDVRGGIWLMDATGAGKRHLTDAGFSPAWSPTGQELAYATEIPTPFDRPRPSRLSIIDVTSGQAREIGPEDGMEPAWSPSGRRVAYWAMGPPSSRRDIFTRPTAGGDPVPVTADAYVDWGPVWSHDGRYLFFCSNRSGSPNLWRVGVDEQTGRVLGEPEPLTTPAAAVMHVSFAADGSRFAYEASDLQANVQRIVFDPVAEAVRGPLAAVTTGTRVWSDVDVSVHGQLVLRSQRRQEDIYVCDADGSNITALAPDENNDRFPRWSPDGTRIAFSSTKGGEGYEIHSIRPDGSDLRRLTFFKPTAVHFPLWSPDGRRLAFTAYITAGGQTYVIDPDRSWPTGPLRPLLTPPEPLDIRYRPWSWSPDGKWIVAYSERGAGMIVYDVATGAHAAVSPVGAKPRWLSDSRRLIYTYDRALHLMDVRTRKSREIFRPAAGAILDPAVSPDDRTIYCILYRDEGSIWVATVK